MGFRLWIGNKSMYDGLLIFGNLQSFMGSNVKTNNLKKQYLEQMWGGFLIPRLSNGMLHFDNDHG